MEFKRVEVQFLDARHQDTLDEIELEEIHETIYNAIGYLIKENQTYIFIAQPILPKNDTLDSTIYRYVLAIPKVAIKKRVELKE